MQYTSNFSSGMNTDISKVFQSKDSYLQALNFRAVTELGDSNGSLVNIKGNECKVKFPTSQDVLKLRVEDMGGTTDDTVTITVNGQTTPSITITSATTGLEIYNLLKGLSNCYQSTNLTPGTATFAVAYRDNYVIITQQPVYSSCSPVSSVFPNTVVNRTVVSPAHTLMFIDIADGPNLTWVSASYVLTHANPYIIGSTFIDNDIYLLVSDEEANIIPDNDSFTGTGSIWKLSIDDITRTSTLTMLYVNYLDFTIQHPVAPSAITGRYESAGIKRLYWTDFYNRIRTVNVADPQLMALPPTLLSVQPNANFSQPILDAIIAGSLDAGCYQLAYRMSQTLGSVTNISELSNPIYLNSVSESANFQDYESSGGTTSKGIRWKIDNLDIRFDNIEFILAYRNTEGAVPTFTSLGTQVLSTTGSMEIEVTTVSGDDFSDITLDEFLLFNATFTHAKTVDTKDNRLFWGNVKSVIKSLDNFDARAFRANDAGNIRLKNGATYTNYLTVGAAVAGQPEDSADAINEYYDSTGEYSSNACYLKPSTSTTTKELGGEGLNISYGFGTKSIQVDNDTSISSSDNWNIGRSGSPYRTNDLTGSVDEVYIYDYPQNNKFQALKQPERTSLFRSLQHEEIYRYAFQAYDKQGNPYFAKWIGDIKMPSYGDTNDHPDSIASGAGITDFRLTFQTSYRITYAQLLYIKFTIDISSIKNIIGGYEIVRVERDGTNKTIWGCGLVNPMMSENADDAGAVAVLPSSFQSKDTAFVTAVPVPQNIVKARYFPYPSQEAVETLNLDNDDNSNPNFAKFKMFDCWDHDFGLRPSYANGDKLLIRSKLAGVNYRNNSGDDSYRQYFDNNQVDVNGDPYSGPVYNGSNIFNSGNDQVAYNFPADSASTNDNPVQPFYIFKLIDSSVYTDYSQFLAPLDYNYPIEHGEFIAGNETTTYNGYTINNFGVDYPDPTNVIITTPSNNPSAGKRTSFLVLGDNPSGDTLYTSDYGCVASTTNPFYKLLALYYKPNNQLYGGNTYAARSNNEYISCSEYISVDDNPIPITFDCFGGDVFTGVYDAQKTFKGEGSEYYYFDYDENSPFTFLGFKAAQAKFSTTFFFPCTCKYNQELRAGNHINKSLTTDAGFDEDEYLYDTYNNAENNIKKFFPKPLDYQVTDEWRARVYYSEIKFDNETTDSWAQYLINSFHDCEGTYGGINTLITLNDQIYYLQDRAIGMLLINPVAQVDAGVGTPVQLGTGATIQRHNNFAIDVGTQHQWSVYRSQSQIMFLDARHRKLYLFNGQSLNPISDKLGQRNYFIKRLHHDVLIHDNPIIDQGVLTTYDYYHNEFLVTILNKTTYAEIINKPEEFYTIAFSEQTGKFTSMYSFLPNIYINSNKYLFSNVNRNGAGALKNSIYLHNYGAYSNFYGDQYPSTLKILVNDNPLYTKIFDNLMWISEAIDDNLEFSDDLNIVPGAVANPAFPDDVPYPKDTFTKVRCYDQYQNTDFINLDQTAITGNLRKTEQGFMLQVPRNKFNYDTNPINIRSLFDPARLTKTTFGERIRDKWMIVDLYYPNTTGNRFVIHTLTSTYRISDR